MSFASAHTSRPNPARNCQSKSKFSHFSHLLSTTPYPLCQRASGSPPQIRPRQTQKEAPQADCSSSAGGGLSMLVGVVAVAAQPIRTSCPSAFRASCRRRAREFQMKHLGTPIHRSTGTPKHWTTEPLNLSLLILPLAAIAGYWAVLI